MNDLDSFYYYDVCYHLDDYNEKNNVEFSNPVHIGDYITDGIGNEEFLVFQVVHSAVGGGSAIHVKRESDEHNR